MTDRPALATMVIQANPVPDPEATAEHLDAYQSLLALIDERSGAMDHHTPTTPPPPARNRAAAWAFAAAFILILIVVGATALFLGGDETQVTDEPASSTTVLETPTTLAAVPPPTVAFDDTGRWQATELSEPWTGEIVDVASLPSGGFVVATTTPRVLWSPDGVDWSDADPQRQISTVAPWFQRADVNAVISVVGDQVVVLDRYDPGLWVGNPQAGAWKSVRFDTADLAGRVEPFAVASNDTEVLVVAVYRPEATSEGNEERFESAEGGYLVWLVNPRTGEVERHPLSPPTGANPHAEELSSGWVEWVNDRWVMALVGDAILVSGDGATWTQVSDENTFDGPLWVGPLTAGPPGVIASTCQGLGAHEVWFSEDGLNWENTGVEAFHMDTAYTDGLGFLIVDGGQQVSASHDGRTWDAKTWHFAGSDPSWSRYEGPGQMKNPDKRPLRGFDIKNLAASGHTVFVDHTEGAFLLTYE